MVLTGENGMAVALCIIIILDSAIRRRLINMNPTRRSCWVRPSLRRHPIFRAFHALLTELSTEDPQSQL